MSETHVPSQDRAGPRAGSASVIRLVSIGFALVGMVLTVAPVDAQNTDLDILSYDLSVRLDLERAGVWAPLNTMTGTARITFVNGHAIPVKRVPVVLNRLLRIDSVHDGRGRPLGFEQRLAGLRDWETYQANVAEILLVKPLLPADTFTVEIAYAGGLSGMRESGMLYVQEILDRDFTILRAESSAYPHLAEPTRASVRRFFGGGDGFDQRLEVTVPEGLLVASGHPMVETRTVDGWVTRVFESQAPVFQIIIPIAPYQVIAVGPHRVYHFPEDREGAERVADRMAAAMDLFSEWFGPVRDSSVFAVAEIPEWHGSQALRPTTLQEATAFREASGMVELYHEVSHFWNVVDPAAESSRWNEGLATYLQNVVAETLDGDTGRLGRETARYVERLRNHLTDNPLHRDVSLIAAGERGLTSTFSYTGGGIFFGLLHHRIGQDRLRAILGSFYQRHYPTGATSQQFAEYLLTEAPEARPVVEDWFLGYAYVSLLLQGLTFDELVERYGVAVGDSQRE